MRIAWIITFVSAENTAHSFTQVEGRLVIMSVHVPRGGAAN